MVAIRKVVRRMRGGSQSWMVEGSDGRFYILKGLNNPQGRRSLINDWVGSRILNLLGAHAAHCTTLHVSQDLVEQHALDIKTDNTSIRLCAGPHFGSLMPVNPEKSVVFDFLPSMMLPRVSNLEDFLVTRLFDKWVSNADTRQAVFYRPGNLKEFRALMVDNGRIFGGELWDLKDFTHGRAYFDHSVYKFGSFDEKLENSFARIERVSKDDLLGIAQTVPREWLAGDAAALESLLMNLLESRRSLRAHAAELVRPSAPGSASPVMALGSARVAV